MPSISTSLTKFSKVTTHGFVLCTTTLYFVNRSARPSNMFERSPGLRTGCWSMLRTLRVHRRSITCSAQELQDFAQFTIIQPGCVMHPAPSAFDLQSGLSSLQFFTSSTYCRSMVRCRWPRNMRIIPKFLLVPSSRMPKTWSSNEFKVRASPRTTVAISSGLEELLPLLLGGTQKMLIGPTPARACTTCICIATGWEDGSVGSALSSTAARSVALHEAPSVAPPAVALHTSSPANAA
mmetsp:Transcript_105924/g.297843  ORF Transcript_105924/g.297843 Transcript_105924/m.297843 type:complete len:237 (+) Transcript_105924:673-1383(+)